MKAPMEKWTKSTFYSATQYEVSNGKMDHIFGNFFSEIYFCDSPLFVCALHMLTIFQVLFVAKVNCSLMILNCQPIKNYDDNTQLQNDLHSLEHWSEKRLLQFNIDMPQNVHLSQFADSLLSDSFQCSKET